MSLSCERVNFEKLKPAGAAEEYALHIAALEWSLAEPIVISSKEDIKSRLKWVDQFEPYHHQVENLITFCRRLPVTLLADDVGLGKTISAGLVLAELIERKRVKRCFVVCPAILVPQWVEELGSKFGIRAIPARGQKELTNAIERSATPVVVTTYQSAGARFEHFQSGQFEMLILDEAHKLRNLHGTDQPPQMALSIKKALESRIFKYVMMLTATPIQNRIWDLYSLIDLLTVAKGHRNPLGTPGEFGVRFIADEAGRKLRPFMENEFRRVLSEYMVRTRRDDAQLKFPNRIVETRKLQGGIVEIRMQELAAKQIVGLDARTQITLSQAMMSSPQAFAKQLENMAANKAAKVQIAQSVADDARRLANEYPRSAKLEGLLELVRELKRQRPQDWRLVVFTLRKETQDAIGRALIAEGVAVDFIRGGSSHANQSTVQGFRADPPKANVIVSTDAGAEGVNLQSGNVLVNYDLPWNPMIVEQRIGRIQRLASKHEYVVVINLVIANSVEEQVVARLLEKLQVIAAAIGDIEAILESAGQDDDDSFEEMIRRMVIDSLKNQNVEEAARKAAESIENAKARMAEERGYIEDTLGPGIFDPTLGPKPPKFEPVKPSIPADQFVMRALSAEGATLRSGSDDVIDVIRRGQAVERITFKPDVVEPANSGSGEFRFRWNAPKLYLPGRPEFERLVQRWLQRSGHCVRDLSVNVEALTHLASKAWCESVPGAVFDSFTIKNKKRYMTGGILCRVKAANGVDGLEKLIPIAMKANGHAPPDSNTVDAAPILGEELSPDTTFGGIESFIKATATDDNDIGVFCNFYEERRREELGKAGGDSRRRHKVDSDFAPKVFADVVAMSGHRYDRVLASVAFVLDGEHRYEIDLELIPASREILSEPQRVKCTLTDRSLPMTCIQACSISGKMATKHLLMKSAASGRIALPEFFVRCGVTGDALLPDETWKSDVSGRVASIALFNKSPISDRKGLKEEFVTCEFTGIGILSDEVVVSSVSGKRLRKDEAVKSAMGGKTGHKSEFVICAESGDVILPDETGASAISGKSVRRDLLIASQKPPHRTALSAETAQCSLTGHVLLSDEVVTSAVSGKLVDKALAVSSELSGKMALPGETVRCEITSQILLPDEVDISDATGKKIRRDLLVGSPISGRKAAAEELKACEITHELVLPDELLKSDESGRLFRCDQVVASAESGRIGHQSEAVLCTGSQKWALRSEIGISSISQKPYRKSLLRSSDKPPFRVGAEEELRKCVKSGKTLLMDEVLESAVSGQLIDRDLAAFSDFSKQPALPEELIRCEETGRLLLPSEVARSSVSNKVVGTDLLVSSQLSGRKGLKGEFRTCEVTGALVLVDELERSDESGRSFRRDEAIRSAESGRIGHKSEMVECGGSHFTILGSEAGKSSISGKIYSKSLLVPSEKSPDRFGIQAEIVTCVKTGKRLLVDEAVKSLIGEQWIDRALAKPSARSGRLAFPEDLVICEKTGKQLLPDECGICSLTNKRVDKTLLGVSNISGKACMLSRLETCAVSGRKALPSELQTCDLSGKRVDPAELQTCAVSHKRAIRYQFVRSDISGVPMLPDYAVWSPTSKRCCTPKESVICTWRREPFPKDEIAICRLTGLTFSRDLMNSANEFRILRDLLDGKEAGADASDLVGWLVKSMNSAFQGLKYARCVFSPDGSVRAVCGEMRAMLGLKVRYAGLLTTEKGARELLGRVVVGKRRQTGWTASE